MEFLFTLVVVIFLVSWTIENHREKLLQKSVKYNRLRKILSDLQPCLAPVNLRLSSLREFRMFDKTDALDMAYSEILKRHTFLTVNNFQARLKSISALPPASSNYVGKKE